MTNYTIRQGNHYTWSPRWKLFTFKKHIAFEASFDSTCLYNIDDNDKHDINKLFGFATTWHHHTTSARIGWRCLDMETIELLTYCYVNGKRKSQYIANIHPNEKVRFLITDAETHYIFGYRNGGHFEQFIENKTKDTLIFNRIMYPYFGGDKAAPHTMKIKLKML